MKLVADSNDYSRLFYTATNDKAGVIAGTIIGVVIGTICTLIIGLIVFILIRKRHNKRGMQLSSYHYYTGLKSINYYCRI